VEAHARLRQRRREADEDNTYASTQSDERSSRSLGKIAHRFRGGLAARDAQLPASAVVTVECSPSVRSLTPPRVVATIEAFVNIVSQRAGRRKLRGV